MELVLKIEGRQSISSSWMSDYLASRMGLLNKQPGWQMHKGEGQSNREHSKAKASVVFFAQVATEAKAVSEEDAK